MAVGKSPLVLSSSSWFLGYIPTMVTRSFDAAPQRYVRTGGALYLAIILLGAFSEGYVLNQFVVSGDVARTAHNIASSPRLWQLAVASDLMVVILAVPLLWIEFLLLRPVSRQWVLLGLLFNVVSLAVEAISKLFLLAVVPTLTHAGYLQAFSPEQLQVLANMALRSHGFAFNIALIFFGFTCMVNGTLIFRSGYLPKLLGNLMQLAGACYLIACFAALLAPAFADLISPAILLPPLIGESSMALWLLFKGVNLPRWRERISAGHAA
jgi:Domain of unknown function (DUF4386)